MCISGFYHFVLFCFIYLLGAVNGARNGVEHDLN